MGRESDRALRAPVTRGQLCIAVVVTALLTGGTMAWAGGPGPTFPDVPTDHPFYDEIEWMAATGITNGFEDGTFKPSQPVTRGSMSAFMQRLYDLQEDLEVASGISSTEFSSTTYTVLAGSTVEVAIPPGVNGYVI